MMKEKVLSVFLVLLVSIPLAVSGGNEVITLKTEKMDDVICISSFLMNGKGEIFLFSSKMSRIFPAIRALNCSGGIWAMKLSSLPL